MLSKFSVLYRKRSGFLFPNVFFAENQTIATNNDSKTLPTY